MTDHEFQNMLLTTLADIKEQGKERYDRLEKRFETIETQAKENNDRLEKRLETIETQAKENNDRLEKRLETIETQAKENNDRLEKRLETIETQAKENNDRLEKRLETIETRVGGVECDVGWIKGKLEGKQESSSRILVVFSTGAAIAAVIIALIALFN